MARQPRHHFAREIPTLASSGIGADLERVVIRLLARRTAEDHERVRHLISRVNRENPLYGAPSIHGELVKLGFDMTVSRHLVRRAR